MILAVLILMCAAVLLFHNTSENNRVEEESIDTVTKLEELVESNSALLKDEENLESNINYTNLDINSSIGTKTSIKINGLTYIGIIYIPSLNNLATPVIDTCTEKNLKVSVCRYAGNLESNNMVIAGHNYKSIFGKLSKLAIGDIAYFKDLEGNVYKYKCKEIIKLQENDVEKMQIGDWDLTLFTCTYDGKERLTFRFELTDYNY